MVSTVLGAGKTLGVGEVKSPGPIYLPRYTHTEPAGARVLFNGAPRCASRGMMRAGAAAHAHTHPAAHPPARLPRSPRYPSSKHADSGPGPGAYAPPLPKGPTYTLRGREAFGSATFGSFMDVPGPGEYPRVETRQTTKVRARTCGRRCGGKPGTSRVETRLTARANPPVGTWPPSHNAPPPARPSRLCRATRPSTA
jgi:hypothetical protein